MARPRSRGSSRIVFGLAVVAVGVLLTLDNLGLFDFDDLWRFWPVVLMLIGISKLSSGEPGRGLLWLAVGTAFLLPVVFEELEWEQIWDFWPLFLVALGLHMVARSLFPRSRRPRPGPAKDRAAPEAELKASAFLTGVERRVTGIFRRGNLAAVMGACDVDLTGTELAPEGAEIEIFAFWGGVTLRVPEDWMVDPRLVVLMGVVEDNTRQMKGSGPGLTVKGMALMGGLEVRN